MSGLYRIGQQAIITRHIYTDEVKDRLAAARAAGETGADHHDGEGRHRDGGGTAAAAPLAGGFLSPPARSRRADDRQRRVEHAVAARLRPRRRPPAG